MANTSSHPVTVNGQRLDTWAYNIEVKQGWDVAPGMRGSNEVAVGSPGQLWVPKVADVGVFGLSMWVSDRDVDGASQGADRYYYWRKNLDTILAILDTTYGPLDVVRDIGNGETRRAWCDHVDAVDPQVFGQQFGRFKVAMDVLGAYWEDTADLTFSTPVGTSSLGTRSATEFRGATAPMYGLRLEILGPITNPQVTDYRTGHYVRYNGAVAAGSTLVIDTAANTAEIGNTSVLDNIVSGGQFNPAIWAMAHAVLPTLAPSVTFAGSGAGSATQLKIIGRRKFK